MLTRTLVKTALGLVVCMSAAIAARAHGQTGGTISGTVTEQTHGTPVGAVQVQVEGTTRGAVTSETGRYTIANLSPGTYTLTFRRVGYTPLSRADVQVATGTVTTLDVPLAVAVLRLQNMVVTATSDPIEGAKIPFSVGRVVAEDIKSVPTLNSAAAAIQGKVAGVSIIRGTGRPGEGVSVQLRTPQNIRKGNGPMYVVDGVILGSTFDATTVDLETLDIESVEVIKGASAAALYGSRAANGVISIRTARGGSLAVGEAMITARGEFGQSYAPQNINVAQHHHFMVNAAGQYVDPNGNPTTSRSNRGIDPNGFIDNPYPGQTFDNIARFFNPGAFQSFSSNVSQRSQATNFLFSGNQKTEAGALAGDDGFTQRSGRVNLDHRFGENLSVSVSAFHSRAIQAAAVSAFRTLLSYEPDVDLGIKDAEGLYIQLPNPAVPTENPLWQQQNENLGFDKRARTLASVDGRYSPLSWLSLSTNLSYDRSDLNDERYTAKGTPASVTNDNQSDGSLEYQNETTDALNASLSATAMHTFGNLNLRLTTSAIAEREKNLFFEIQGADFTTVGTPDIDNARSITCGGTCSSLEEVRSEGYSANLGLDYAGKYIFDGVIRRDGSSLFGPENRWNTYGRVSGAYRMAEETWWPVAMITDFKPRFAVGTAGTRPDFEDQYETWNVADGAITKGTLGNRFLKPAVTTEMEFGLDMVFVDRYSLELNYVRSETVDQVSDIVLPAVSGYTNQWRNTGSVEGHVIELTAQAQLINRTNFTWSTTLIADRGRNKITAWNTACEIGTLTNFCPGFSLADMYGQRFVRSVSRLPARFAGAEELFQINDDGFLVPVGAGANYTDVQNFGTRVVVNGVSLDWGFPIVEENPNGTRLNTILGNSHPDAQIGWLNNINWRGFRVHTQLHAQIGGEVYNHTKQRMYQDLRHGDLDQSAKPLELKKPFGYYATIYNRADNTDHFVEDGTYLKLRELAVSYRLSRAQLNRVGLGNWAPDAIALGIVGRNLFTVTGYSGWDPEVGSANTRFDNFSYPPPRNFTASFEIFF